MDLKRLRTFVAAADLGTVSKAALHLRISQSALSRQISDLEYECGFKLFDRIGRRLFLTTRGEQLLGDCREVLGQLGSLFGSFEVDHELVFRWRLHRQVSRFLTLEDSVNVGGCAPIWVDSIRTVRNQTAVGDEGAIAIDRG
jgi:DNA-binding transcriptional LysR family regulator